MAQTSRRNKTKPTAAEGEASLKSDESPITASTSLPDVAFIVCTALHDVGLQVVLTGGGAATIYAPEACQSRGLDFMVTFSEARTGGEVDHEAALARLGYRRRGVEYAHDTNELTLDFPPGPLAIGGDIITAWDTLERNRRRLNILTPTDACRDRLASFLFWSDRSGLEQALAVARTLRERVDLELIREWCLSQGHEDKFRQFMRELGIAR